MFVSTASCEINASFEFCWYRNICPHYEFEVSGLFFLHSTSRIVVSPIIRYLSCERDRCGLLWKAERNENNGRSSSFPSPLRRKPNYAICEIERECQYGTRSHKIGYTTSSRIRANTSLQKDETSLRLRAAGPKWSTFFIRTQRTPRNIHIWYSSMAIN